MNHTHRWQLPSPEEVQGPECTGVCACGATKPGQKLASAEWQIRDKAIVATVYARRSYPKKDLAETYAA